MGITLHTDPGTPPLTWDEFRIQKPGYSIALDGYVSTGPRYDLLHPKGPYLNFNHHEDCDRLATRATCGQVLMAVKQGLFDSLKPTSDALHRAHVWVNDCDEDVCVSWFLLRHWSLVERPAYLKLTELVQIADTLDSTAGAYPYPKDLTILQDLAWVFEPYRDYRLSGNLDRKDPEGQKEVIEAVEDRILLHITGEGKSIPLDTRYNVIKESNIETVMSPWVMVEEVGAQAKTGLFGNGVKAYVAVRPRPGGKTWTYTIGRLSPFIRGFDIPALFVALNNAEQIGLENPDRWGGGNTIGGSPRVGGSNLPPDEVFRVVSETIGG